MNAEWMVTPYFFETRDPALCRAVPEGVGFKRNDPGEPPDRMPDSLSRLHRPVADFTARAAGRGVLAVSVAGDCCAALPVMAGLQRAGLDPVLVWLDAHGDFNVPETSPSGFLGGMPLAMMVGRGDMDIAQACALAPVAETSVWLVGAHDLDPPEAAALAASAINRAQVGDLSNTEFDRPVHLHIDNDVIDAADVPANNYPADGGPTLGETVSACVALARRNRLCAVSFSGWNGVLDRDGRTARACRELLGAVVGAATA